MRTVSENIQSGVLNLSEIGQAVPRHGDVVVQTILIYALNELRDLVNVGKNLTDSQIAFTAQRIAAKYGYFGVGEIKYVLYHAIEKEQLFDRLDPNMVLGWFATYEAERAREAERLSYNESIEAEKRVTPSENGISWDAYVESLWNHAMYADEHAVEMLSQIIDKSASRMRLLTKDQKHEQELEFKQFYYKYLRERK